MKVVKYLKKVNFISNNIPFEIILRFNENPLRIDFDRINFEENLKESLKDIIILDSGIILDSPVYNTKFWLFNGSDYSTYNENDTLIKCELHFDLDLTEKVTTKKDFENTLKLSKALFY